MNKVARTIDKYSFKILIYVFVVSIVLSIIFRAYCHFYYGPKYYGSFKDIFSAPIFDINYIKAFFKNPINQLFLSIIIVPPVFSYAITAVCSKIVEREDDIKLKEELADLHKAKKNKKKI